MNHFIITILICSIVLCTTTSAYEPISSNYEFVKIEWPRLQKRSTNKTIPLSFKVFNKIINLNLKPVDDIIINDKTPVYNIEQKKSTLYVKRSKIFENMPYQIYEDAKNFASVVVNIHPNGEKTLENGIIGVHNIVLRPATEKHLSILGKKKNIYKGITDIYIVYTRTMQAGRFLNPLEGTFQPVHKSNLHPAKIPDVIYPEVLVIVDYNLVQNLAKNSVVPYVMAFWNQVDLMYRSLSNPKYRINIAGIIIPKNSEAVSYISSVRAQYRSNEIDFTSVLERCQRWLYNNQKVFLINSYDVAITMTSTKSNTASNLLGLLGGQEIGLAILSSACEVNHFTRKVLKTGIILDNADFSGVPTAAHELGHTLGSHHDNGMCPAGNGFLMAPAISDTANRFTWSKCSLQYFRNFLNQNPMCLYNPPN